MFKFKIEYEISPLRAIYFQDIIATDPAQALVEFRKQGANYRVRKWDEMCCEDDGKLLIKRCEDDK